MSIRDIPYARYNSTHIYNVNDNQIGMRIIRAPSIGRAHELVIKMILEKGWILQTEDAEATVEYRGDDPPGGYPSGRTNGKSAFPVPAEIC